MQVLVSGARGYIGTILASALMGRGYEVVGLDTGFYEDGWLYDAPVQVPRCIQKDVRLVTAADVKGFDAVVHLADLSNDPLGQLNPGLTYEINHAGAVRLARAAKAAGVGRFVYTSSCSIYGMGSDDYQDEACEPRPLTAYAECKVLVERDVSALADDGFSPTFLRNSTVYGASPRMRFDLVLNNLAGHAWTNQRIAMNSDGKAWRPMIHVHDVCGAVACALEAPREIIHNEIFNVGDNSQNYQIEDIAAIVAEAFPGCRVTLEADNVDRRSYRVSFDKINARLPGFRCEKDVADGARELRALFERIQLSREMFEFRAFTRVRQLEHLIRTGQLDDRFFWKGRSVDAAAG